MPRLYALLASFCLAFAVTPAAAQSFGTAVGVSGSEVLVGQPDFDREPGAVFVYRRDGGSWAEAGRFSASDGSLADRFGVAMAVDGERVLIGAAWADSGRGAAYVFERGSGGAWREVARLVPQGAVRGDSLGLRVALESDVALIGYGRQPRDGRPGRVAVFRRDRSGDWRENGALTVTGVGKDDGFGRTLAVGKGFAAVGAASRDSATGAVWVFPERGDGWGEPQLLTGPEKRTFFGSALAVMGDQLLIGAPALERGRGAILVFRRDASGWREAERIRLGAAGDRLFFGSQIAASGDGLLVGAGLDPFYGAIYPLSRAASVGWSIGERIEVPDIARNDGLGGYLALGGSVAAAGLPGDDYGAGTAAILEREGASWRFAARVASELQPLSAILGGSIECTGRVAIFPCQQVDLVAFLPVQSIGGRRGVELNDIWGWTDPQTGKEYALVGRVDGTSFVDISDPQNPVYVGDLPKTEGVPGSTWRDIKVYKDHAYIVADGAQAHGMQVFDLTRLRNVQNPPATFTPETTYHRIHSAHNIVINEESGFAYTVGNSDGGDTCGGGLHMIDIRDPKRPVFAGCFSDPSTGRQKTGYTHDAQCVIYRGPDERYRGREICIGSNETALSIADVTDKRNPRAISMAEYPNVGYTHQAWLTEDHHYLLMDDELDELNGLVDNTRTLIWDVSDLEDPIVIKEFLNPNTTSSDHNQYVVGDKVFQSNYVAGLRVIDISDIHNPYEAGFFDTVPYGSDGPRFDGSWSNYPFFQSGVIVVTSGREGLFLLRYRPAGDRPVS